MNKRYLLEGCQDLLDLTSEWISEATIVDWRPTRGDQGREDLFQLAVLAIVTKQHGSLLTIQGLSEHKESFSAVPLLRAMCEELIWIRYLARLSPTDQGAIIADLASIGLSDAISAQDALVPSNVDFGIAWRAQLSDSTTAAKTELRGLFASQGFNLRGSAATPSVAQLAKRADLESTYKFLYRATSRAVHFSVPELLRRVWGRPGSMKVSSNTFERYWSAFSLYWGGWLYSLTFLESLLILQQPDFPDEKILGIQAAVLRIKTEGAIPLLTREEVRWPESWITADENGGDGAGPQPPHKDRSR